MDSSSEIFGAIRCSKLSLSESATTPDSILDGLNLKKSSTSRDLVQKLLSDFIPIGELERACYSDGPDNLMLLQIIFQKLIGAGLLQLATAQDKPIALLEPTGPAFSVAAQHISSNKKLRLSRFAYIRKSEDGFLVLESPRGSARIVLLHQTSLSLLLVLARGVDSDQLSLEPEGRAFLQLLLLGRFLDPCYDCDHTEEADSTLSQWEFHDLLFHSRSRLGRHDSPIGGNYRFQNVFAPQPALKNRPWKTAGIQLYRPDLQLLTKFDEPFTAILERRRSIRGHGTNPICVAQLGEFLYRSARVKSAYQTNSGEFTSRPYPSGGASYELEIYVTINSCTGIDRGVYYYDAGNHSLQNVHGASNEMELLLNDAWLASAMTCRPQVLITMTSRFQRVAWKYQGMAYATMLKNVGALYSTMYLVGTAMCLAPCALGLGNSDRFCKIAGLNYYEEGSIGEFMIGSDAEQQMI